MEPTFAEVTIFVCLGISISDWCDPSCKRTSFFENRRPSRRKVCTDPCATPPEHVGLPDAHAVRPQPERIQRLARRRTSDAQRPQGTKPRLRHPEGCRLHATAVAIRGRQQLRLC